MSRELTRQEKAAIRSLVTTMVRQLRQRALAACRWTDPCYMLGKCWTGAYCRYFRAAVLPLDPVLEAVADRRRACPGNTVLPGVRQSLSPGRTDSGIVPRPAPRQAHRASSSGRTCSRKRRLALLTNRPSGKRPLFARLFRRRCRGWAV